MFSMPTPAKRLAMVAGGLVDRDDALARGDHGLGGFGKLFDAHGTSCRSGWEARHYSGSRPAAPGFGHRESTTCASQTPDFNTSCMALCRRAAVRASGQACSERQRPTPPLQAGERAGGAYSSPRPSALPSGADLQQAQRVGRAVAAPCGRRW